MRILGQLFSLETYHKIVAKPIRLVDLGCGNGRFIDHFVSHSVDSIFEACIGVDPYTECLVVASTQPNITQTMCMSATEFSKQVELRYSHILMKEMVHHLDVSMLHRVFEGIYAQLDDHGRVVVVTRPVETQYPFFDRIHHHWKTTQTPYEEVVSSMKEAGFAVWVETVTRPITIPKEDWLSFIENQTWSTFSMCSEQEMIDGLSLLRTELDDTVTFDETLIFIMGIKEA